MTTTNRAFDRIDSRRTIMIETALAINDYIDCDVIQESVDNLRDANNKDSIVDCANNLITAVGYRRANTNSLHLLLEEIKAIN